MYEMPVSFYFNMYASYVSEVLVHIDDIASVSLFNLRASIETGSVRISLDIFDIFVNKYGRHSTLKERF